MPACSCGPSYNGIVLLYSIIILLNYMDRTIPLYMYVYIVHIYLITFIIIIFIHEIDNNLLIHSIFVSNEHVIKYGRELKCVPNEKQFPPPQRSRTCTSCGHSLLGSTTALRPYRSRGTSSTYMSCNRREQTIYIRQLYIIVAYIYCFFIIY